MSNVNIKRLVENIRANTTVYTPVVETIVNAIQAIDEVGREDGRVSIRVLRSLQSELGDTLPEVSSFEIEDNGIGFNDAHRDSFDTLYTDLRIEEGGKGFGRFTSLKYFRDLEVKSVYRDNGRHIKRSFSMGKGNEIIVDEKVADSDQEESGTVVTLRTLKAGRSFDKRLQTIGRNLVERLLPYFIKDDYTCPEIVLLEEDGTDEIRLNDFVSNELSAEIQELEATTTFTLKAVDTDEDFHVRVFKLYSPRNQKSRISLVAHKREVSGSAIYRYVPEFADEFYDQDTRGASDRERNYIVKAYVFGAYLDRNVSLERGSFEFQMDTDLVLGISQRCVEARAAEIASQAMGAGISSRQEKKRVRVQRYVDEEAPWHKDILRKIDLSGMPYKPSNEEIEARLQKEKFAQEVEIKRGVAEILAETSFEDVEENTILEIVSKISGTSKNELIHYIALRKKILDILGRSLEADESGVYTSEGKVHDIIFPRRGDTERTSFRDHNLWIIDERLNFTAYVSSDIPLDGGNTERPDLLVYNRRVLFRGDNEASNPITIFEFKKPQRDDFVNPSFSEDPVQQIVRYVNDIRDGKFKTPEGRRILVAANTPFYGYVVCDLTAKVEKWLEREKDFKPMPDRLGWFQWKGNINLYVEVISWDKVLKDAQMRNEVFFQKLGI